MYFIADILYSLALLSKVPQYKLVNATTIGSIIKTKIAQIRMLVIIEPSDLNANTFNEDTSYHVISEYGPLKGHLREAFE